MHTYYVQLLGKACTSANKFFIRHINLGRFAPISGNIVSPSTLYLPNDTSVGRKVRMNCGGADYVIIEPREVNFIGIRGLQYTRRPFLLMLSYAHTVHKGQGCSVERALLWLDDAFEDVHEYVALSRFKS
jgi:hypothetical protein